MVDMELFGLIKSFMVEVEVEVLSNYHQQFSIEAEWVVSVEAVVETTL